MVPQILGAPPFAHHVIIEITAEHACQLLSLAVDRQADDTGVNRIGHRKPHGEDNIGHRNTTGAFGIEQQAIHVEQDGGGADGKHPVWQVRRGHWWRRSGPAA